MLIFQMCYQGILDFCQIWECEMKTLCWKKWNNSSCMFTKASIFYRHFPMWYFLLSTKVFRILCSDNWISSISNSWGASHKLTKWGWKISFSVILCFLKTLDLLLYSSINKSRTDWYSWKDVLFISLITFDK